MVVDHCSKDGFFNGIGNKRSGVRDLLFHVTCLRSHALRPHVRMTIAHRPRSTIRIRCNDQDK